MLAFSIALLVLACLIAVFKWRWGLGICVLVALIQDPLRKLTPGAPVAYVVFVGIAFAAAWLGAWINGTRMGPSVVYGWRQRLQTPATLLFALLAVQTVHSVARWGNPILPAIGAIFYLAPIFAIVFAHQYAVRTGSSGMLRFMAFYVALTLVWLFGVLAEIQGVQARALGEVGVGQIIYSFGLNRKAASGFYRAAEVAAWHIGMVSCFLFILLNGRRLSVFKSLLVAIVVFFIIYVGFYTGRRKMLVYLVVFVGTYITLYAWFLRGKARVALMSMLLFAVAFGVVLTLGADPGESSVEVYDKSLGKRDVEAAWVARGLSVFEDIPARFQLLAYRPVEWAVDAYGWFGAGLGVTAQGAQHFGGGAARFGGAAEGGLGKLTMDLGVPGMLVFLWVAFCVVRETWRRLGALARGSRPHAMLAFGLVGVLAANGAAFSVATQVFGDVFVLLIIGWTVGFLLALPAVAYRETAVAAPPPVQTVEQADLTAELPPAVVTASV